MSKPISFGFGKVKQSTPSAPAAAKSSTTSISLPLKKPSSLALHDAKVKPPRTALRGDESDASDEEPPKHEAVTGLTSSGFILTQPKTEREERVIENKGNQDWRRRGRGRNILPDEVRAAQENGGVVMVEKDEVSKASGLQFAEPTTDDVPGSDGNLVPTEKREDRPVEPVSADEEALKALLDDGSGKPKGSATIIQQPNTQMRPQDETEDFRTDVASRPDSATLEDYAAMPVEEFGLAMLRGMGKKRRANGEVINLEGDKNEQVKKQKKNEGFLGIGAKAAPGMDGIELGAWGKADMRKNNKGAGFFTPVMLVDKRTGEKITEDELERRKRESRDKPKTGKDEEEDWRSRRDKNLERDGRDGHHRNGDDKYRDQMNGFSKRDSDASEAEYESPRSRRERDDRDHDSSRSRRERSRSKDRKRRGDDNSDSSRHRDRDRDRDRDRYRDKHHDDSRYGSTSSSKNDRGNRDDNRHRDRDRDRDRDARHERNYDRDDRRHRDRR